MALIAEVTHRCPMQCPYCSNPLNLGRAAAEMDTATWSRVLEEAAALGVLHVHFTGGEPTARRDLPVLVRRATELQLYSNLITSGVVLDERLMAELVAAGIDHIQLSFQDIRAPEADRLGGLEGAHDKKLAAARLVKAAGIPLTANFVVHRQNLGNVHAMIALGEYLGADRIEIAHVQYYGWALLNRNALLPSREQLEQATRTVESERRRLDGRIVIDYVIPDYYASRPKACMGGWARRLINVSPSGRALPCHAAETLPGFVFPSVRDQSLADIWEKADLFTCFRGTDWMPKPCRDCDLREIDWGGCRCQAFALTGDAARTDPACDLAPGHFIMADAVLQRGDLPPGFTPRRMRGAEAMPQPR